METSLNVTDYPIPEEVPEKRISGEITLTYQFETDVYETWDKEDILRDIKENLSDYIDVYDYNDIEIDI